MADNAVARRGVSIELACRAFGVSGTCYRYGPKLRAETEEIADLLVGLTDARKTRGFGLCFLHLCNVKGHSWNHKRVYRIYCKWELNPRITPPQAVDAGQTRRPRGAGGAQHDLVDALPGRRLTSNAVRGFHGRSPSAMGGRFGC